MAEDPGETTPLPPIEVIDDPSRAAHLLDPIRQRILEELREPGSAPELGRRLGLPRQRIGYHLRELEQAGLIYLVEERRKRNCRERVLRASAVSYVISPAALGRLGRIAPEPLDRFSWSCLARATARAIRDLGALRRHSAASGQRPATLAIEAEIRLGSIGHQVAFAHELREQIARLAAKYDDQRSADGRVFRLVAASYSVAGDPPAEPTAAPVPRVRRRSARPTIR